jgi:hypothetical protein
MITGYGSVLGGTNRLATHTESLPHCGITSSMIEIRLNKLSIAYESIALAIVRAEFALQASKAARICRLPFPP